MCARSVHSPRSAIVENGRMSVAAPEIVLEQLRRSARRRGAARGGGGAGRRGAGRRRGARPAAGAHAARAGRRGGRRRTATCAELASSLARARGAIPMKLAESNEHERFRHGACGMGRRADRHRDPARRVISRSRARLPDVRAGTPRGGSRSAGTSPSTRSPSAWVARDRGRLRAVPDALERSRSRQAACAARAELPRRSDASAADGALPGAARI